MAASGGAGKRRSERDKARAADMKRRGVVRTTGRCPQCYRIVTCDSAISRYKHVCTV